MRIRGLRKQRAQRRSAWEKVAPQEQAASDYTRYRTVLSGQHHMVVPVESRLKGCQHRAPKVRKSGSRGCRQAKCVSKLQRQQPHICLEVKQPTSWLELPPSLGGAGGLDAAPAAERLLLQARETLCSGRTGARLRSQVLTLTLPWWRLPQPEVELNASRTFPQSTNRCVGEGNNGPRATDAVFRRTPRHSH